MDRRLFLATSLSTAAGRLLSAQPASLDWSRISVLTDECATSPEDAIAFCHKYKLTHVELRDVPGRKGTSYAKLEDPELKQAAAQLKEAGLKVTFLNTGMLKFSLPGTEPIRKTPETPERKAQREKTDQERFERRMDDLHKAVRVAQIFNVDKVRVFAFSRTAEPETLFPRIAEILGPMGDYASKEGVQLLVENEGSCNVGSSAELAKLVNMLPEKQFGLNWDPENATRLNEVNYPDGYNLLPKPRVKNIQIKARGLLIQPPNIDWKGIFAALAKDGYPGQVGLETHIFDGTLIEKANLCMAKIHELVG